MYNEVMENTDFVIEHIDKEVKVITDRPSSVVNYPANTDFFIENIDDNVISIAHSLNIEASEVEFRPANTDFFIENIDNNVIMIADSLELIPSEVTIRPANTDFFVENIDKNLIAIAEYYDLEPSRVVLRPANTDMFIENIDRNVTLIKSRTNVITKSGSFINVDVPDGGTMQLTAINGNATQTTYSGKNLMPILDGTTTLNGVTATVTDGILTLNGTSTGSAYIKLTNGLVGRSGASIDSAWLNENVTNDINGKVISFDYLSGTAPSSSWAFRRFSTSTSHDQQWLAVTSDTSTAYPTSGGHSAISCLAVYINASMTFSNYKVAIQLEVGSTATDFQKYVGGIPAPNPAYPQNINVVTGTQTIDINGTSYPINLGNIWLAKIGTYQDRIYKDAETNKWYIEKQVEKATVSLGTTVYTLSGGLKGATYAPAGKVNDAGGALCDKATPWPGGEAALWNGCYYENPSNFMFVGSTTDTTDTLKAKYDGAVLYYRLATPTTTEITDETLLSQLNFVADMYEGINNISFVGTGAQGTIEVVINKN